VPRLNRAHLLGMLAGGMLAAILALAWPYYSVVQTLTEVEDLDKIHAVLYADIWGWYGLGLAIGLPAVALRLRRSPLDPFALLCAMAGAVVLYGGISGHYAWGRTWPVLMLTVQIALAVELTRVATAIPLRVAWAVVAAVGCAVGAVFQYGNLLLVLPPQQLTAEVREAHHVAAANPYGWAEQHLASGEVVVVTNQRAARILLRDGVRFVVPPWPEPLLHDIPMRMADQNAMLDARTSESERKRLFAKYRIDWVLDLTGRFRWLDRYALEVVHGPDKQRLIRIS
jgi:hypothetical protein